MMSILLENILSGVANILYKVGNIIHGLGICFMEWGGYFRDQEIHYIERRSFSTLGNFLLYETSFELPDYGELSFKRDIDVALKYIDLLETLETNKDNDEFSEFKISYNKKGMNGAVESIPPSRRNLPEFKNIVSKMRALGYEPPEPIKYTSVPT